MSGPTGGHPREVLSAYLDDELAVEERMAVDRHLAECEDCRAQLSALGHLSRAVRDEGVPEVPADLVERVGRRIDAATLLRPARFRLAIPATIAATIAALGILVALQWREGGLMRPAMPEPRMNRLPEEPVNAPAGSVEERSKSDHLLDKDSKAKAAPIVTPTVVPDVEKELKEESVQEGTGVDGGTPGGIVGGVVGGVAGGVQDPDGDGNPNVNGARERDFSADERRDRLAQVPSPAQAPPPARSVAPMDQAPAAKAVAASPCGERWTDSGVRGTWDVADAAKAARELDRMARDVAGTGSWRGVADGRPYQLVVPRAHFEEVFFALRARGVLGLDELPVVRPGDDCAALSITINGRADP